MDCGQNLEMRNVTQQQIDQRIVEFPMMAGSLSDPKHAWGFSSLIRERIIRKRQMGDCEEVCAFALAMPNILINMRV